MPPSCENKGKVREFDIKEVNRGLSVVINETWTPQINSSTTNQQSSTNLNPLTTEMLWQIYDYIATLEAIMHA